MQLSSDLFYQGVEALENHPESLRMKKLIFCICQNSWENDAEFLNNLPLDSFVKKLIQEHPTVEELTLALYKLVKTLNRPKVYAGVAKGIIEALSPIYKAMNQPAEFIELNPHHQQTQVSDVDFLLEQAARNLSNHKETARIHKLIYALAKNNWENNLAQIQSYGLKNLIAEILDIYQTKQDLANAFAKLVENINKKSVYVAISKIILGQLRGLYDNRPAEESNEPETSLAHENTQIIAIRPAQNPEPISAVEIPVIDITSEPRAIALKPEQAVNSPTKKPDDLYEVRLEIMQYTNPLRAKILLFSLLFHTWDRSEQDWSMLRSYTLDDLLEQILQSGQPMTDIETKLYQVAQSLNDSENHLQAASTIVEAIKPFI